jgi:hypothetical protein
VFAPWELDEHDLEPVHTTVCEGLRTSTARTVEDLLMRPELASCASDALAAVARLEGEPLPC